MYKRGDRIQDSIRNNSSVWIDYIELRTQLNQFEMFVSNLIHEEHWKLSVLEGKQCCSKWKIVLKENDVNRESKRLELTI